MRQIPKYYDRAYFDKWYRDSRFSVGSRDALKRKVHMVVAVAEHYLGRPIRTVLDIGCGEGAWHAPLKALRPKVHYLGIDSSEYAVRRYGRARNLRLGRFGHMGEQRFNERFDVIVCTDVLHYLRPAEIRQGLDGFSDLLEGIAFLEVYTSRDKVSGDHEGYIARSPHWYLSAFGNVGLIPCGSHCYLSPLLMGCVAALELPSR